VAEHPGLRESPVALGHAGPERLGRLRRAWVKGNSQCRRG
jgi:hypothetical protein